MTIHGKTESNPLNSNVVEGDPYDAPATQRVPSESYTGQRVTPPNPMSRWQQIGAL